MQDIALTHPVHKSNKFSPKRNDKFSMSRFWASLKFRACLGGETRRNPTKEAVRRLLAGGSGGDVDRGGMR